MMVTNYTIIPTNKESLILTELTEHKKDHDA